MDYGGKISRHLPPEAATRHLECISGFPLSAIGQLGRHVVLSLPLIPP